MAGLWQRTGNVTVTNGSKTITGFGTKWKTGTLPIQKGHAFYGPDNFAYEVDTVVSDESLTLVEAYRGSTLANQAYRIDITRTSTISQFAADLASLVAKYRAWFDGMMTWLTGSGDVAILNPDTGANITIPSWKKVASEGEGQTARAKVEADRAKTEADRAVTEADRAAGIVAAAALPLPDVWVPFSDSLRMITGHGRDVLVGSDVVARMVNFSRSSTATYIGKDGLPKTAAVNEPRFEKDGLLVEGQSTNLVPSSEGAVYGAGNAGFQAITNGVSGVLPVVGQRIVFSPNAGETNATLAQFPLSLQGGQTYTFSFFMKVEQGPAVQIPENSLGVYSTATTTIISRNVVRDFGNGVYRVALTFSVGGTGSQPVHLRFSRGGAASESWVGVIGGSQVENLPLASSYIPTAGAAVTRAADIVTIPWAMNINPATVTVALNYDLLGVGQANQRIIEYAAPAVPRYLMQVTPGGDFESYCATSALKVTSPPIGPGSLAVASTSPTRHALRLTGKIIATATPTGPAGATSNVTIGAAAGGSTPMFGHVRNLRIWHKALTDDQLKAVA
ncbi:phage head spike fiber domain-containing protein [Aeromonas media]|uniref:phage head spike fiber domain-containing protein n=1 Tax=Aeromonas media TaxID=651 RepID=UPI002280C3E0|nr:hypothetical protein [Aeromonas media]MCY9821145.1 hypothetical protein [Aeromonas media]